ncbi:MAG: CDP-diacylglycerol--glycerol-3-phosphate 3-phosphatidyltransferase [Pseudomonadota bacterium]
MVVSLPNILTVIRLLAAPAVALAYIVMPHPFSDWTALALFLGAAFTDWLDGVLARAWDQESRFGAMLDPIADKAMVVIALSVLVGLFGLRVWIVIPVTVILFREVFVSGLREYLGAKAGTLKVTQLAKWKTTVQMVAISVLLASGVFQHYFGMWSWGMSGDMVAQVLDGSVPDELGLRSMWRGFVVTSQGGLLLLWIAAGLTLLTGIDYFKKAWNHLKDTPDA